MRALSFVLLALGLLTAAPVAGQAPITPNELRAGLRIICDSIPRIRGDRAVDTALRNRLSRLPYTTTSRCGALLLRPLKVDTVFLPAPPDTTPVPPDPPTGEVFDTTFAGVVTGDVACPDGKRCKVGVLEIRRGSLRTESGTLVFRDGSRLLLSGGIPTEYVGGGMYWTPELGKTDFGVWVGGANATGRLDIACTPKTAWNRTGRASDWSSTDELWVAPVNAGDYAPRRYTLGAPIPRADSIVPPAEVINVTRGCSIEGVGHIHIHSNAPQKVENIQLRGLGVSNAAGPVLGRYALHCHMSGEGTKGSVFRGVAAIDSRGSVFVPHSCSGTTWTEDVSVNAQGDGFWWDQAHATDDILVDRMVVCGVRGDAYLLGAGSNMEMRNSVACGANGNDQSVGFEWPEPTPIFEPVFKRLVWKFDQGNVSHNNVGSGLRFWNNGAEPHAVRDYVSYHNRGGGVENGAYVNLNFYDGVTTFEDGYEEWFGGHPHPALIWNNNSGDPGDGSGRTSVLRNARLHSLQGPALTIGHRQVPAGSCALFEALRLMPASGQPKVYVLSAIPESSPWRACFVRSGVTAADFVFESYAGANEGSEILIDNDGDGLYETRVYVQNGQKKVETR